MEPATNDLREWLIAGAAIVGALGTSGAVLYALYRDTFREARRRPHLSLELDARWGPSNLDLVTVASPRSHWVRMRVANERGRRSAEDVEVLVTRVRPLGEEDLYEAPLDTRPLAWSNLISPNGQPVTKVHLPPGVSRYVDLISVRPPLVPDGGGDVREARPGETVVCMPRLEVRPEPSDRRHWLAQGRYRIDLVISARDVDAQSYETEIEFDGIWRDVPEIWDHLTIGALTSVGRVGRPLK